MQLSNFRIAKDEIALEIGDGYYDLHNCFDFIDLKYDVAARSIEFNWKKNAGNWVPADSPETIQLLIEGVQFFKAKERDSETLYTDDNCLNCIGFIGNDLFDVMDGIRGHEPGPDCTHFCVIFESGFAVKIGTETAAVKINGCI